MFAPGVEIKNVFANSTKRTIATSNPEEISGGKELSNMYVSNDPDLLVRSLKKGLKTSGNAGTGIEVIHITPQASDIDLLGKREETFNEGTGKFEFTYHDQPLIELLKQGKIAVLVGALSPTLYQQLLPLQSGKKELWINGQWQTIPGKLIVVTSLENGKLLQPLSVASVTYNLSDYKKLMSHDDQDNFTKLENFYSLASKLRHIGTEMPVDLHLSFSRIERSLKELKEHKFLHKQNPLKGIFLFDYGPAKENYAYLNVLGKLFFAAGAEHLEPKQMFSTYSRLHRLLAKFNLNKQGLTLDEFKSYRWQLLNSFNAAELRENVFGYKADDLQEVLDFAQSPPGFKQSVMLQKACDYINKILKLDEKSFIKDAVQKETNRGKTFERLHAAVDDPNNPVAFVLGESGVGKTHIVNQLAQSKYGYTIYEDIEQALLNTKKVQSQFWF